jgi:hypothetical protein
MQLPSGLVDLPVSVLDVFLAMDQGFIFCPFKEW